MTSSTSFRRIESRVCAPFASHTSSADSLIGVGTSGKTILRHILTTRTPELPSKIAEDLKLLAASDDGASLEKWCREAIAALPEEADVVRRGNFKVVNKIMGHVMKASRGTAKAQDVRAMLLKLLQ